MEIMVGPCSPFLLGQLIMDRDTARSIQSETVKGIDLFMAGLHNDMERIDCGEKPGGDYCCSEAK